MLADKETEGSKFKDYFDFNEPVVKIPIAHRMLAVLRGFLGGFSAHEYCPVEEDALYIIEQLYVKRSYAFRRSYPQSD